jgi:hypothetical protein
MCLTRRLCVYTPPDPVAAEARRARARTTARRTIERSMQSSPGRLPRAFRASGWLAALLSQLIPAPDSNAWHNHIAESCRQHVQRQRVLSGWCCARPSAPASIPALKNEAKKRKHPLRHRTARCALHSEVRWGCCCLRSSASHSSGRSRRCTPYMCGRLPATSCAALKRLTVRAATEGAAEVTAILPPPVEVEAKAGGAAGAGAGADRAGSQHAGAATAQPAVRRGVGVGGLTRRLAYRSWDSSVRQPRCWRRTASTARSFARWICQRRGTP